MGTYNAGEYRRKQDAGGTRIEKTSPTLNIWHELI